MKSFCFTVDDNIRFLKELCEYDYSNIFEHPYIAMYKRLHEKYGLKIQLNLFYECDGFTLSDMTDKFKQQFAENSDWLKFSFHSRLENVNPYEFSGYEEVFTDAKLVNYEIIRFSTNKNLAKTTTIHYCRATAEGVSALYDNGVCGLLGLYGSKYNPRISYTSTPSDAALLEAGEKIKKNGITYAAIDLVINLYQEVKIPNLLDELFDRDFIKVMIHEQYFYSDYKAYQPDFENKLDTTFKHLCKNGYSSIFFEDCI